MLGNRLTLIAFLTASAGFSMGCKSSCGAISPDTRVVAAAGDAMSACAIVQGGRVHCWHQRAAYWVPGIADAESLSVHETLGCALRRGGLVSCWRYSAYLGKERVDVQDARLESPTRVAVTLDRACAIVADGGVSCWSIPRFASEPLKPERDQGVVDVIDLAYYYGVATALLRGGVVVSLHSAVVATVPDAVQVVAGDNFACLRTRAGIVSCWGDNWMGRLGDGTLAAHDDPRPVVGLSDVVEIAAGNAHACARHTDGSVSCWGSNQKGQVGVTSAGLSDSRRTPVRVPDVRADSLVAAGNGTCAITTAHQLLCWGSGNGFQTREVCAGAPSP